MKFGVLLFVVGCLIVVQGPVKAQAIVCESGSSRDLGCVGAEPAMPDGYNDPPQHQPSRCEVKPVTKVSIEGIELVRKKFSKLAKPKPMGVFIDTTPTFTPVDLAGMARGYDFGDGPFSFELFGGAGSRHLYSLYESYCVEAVTGEVLLESHQTGWVKVVSVENLTSDLLVQVSASMSDVTFTWPTVSPTHGWQMVKVPLEIRGEVPDTIDRSMSASNASGTLTVSITATPSRVVFLSGDNDAPVVCPIEAMSWPVPLPEQASSCSYSYRHSSVQREGQPFTTQLVTVWEVQTPDPQYNGAWPLPAVTTDLLVAETQALVTG